MESRPPLRIDMSGPTPTTYSPRNKPLYETNAPAYSFGRKDPEISKLIVKKDFFRALKILHPLKYFFDPFE